MIQSDWGPHEKKGWGQTDSHRTRQPDCSRLKSDGDLQSQCPRRKPSQQGALHLARNGEDGVLAFGIM